MNLVGLFHLLATWERNIHNIYTISVTKGFYSGSALGIMAPLRHDFGLASELQREVRN
jgi:hypothetical protein